LGIRGSAAWKSSSGAIVLTLMVSKSDSAPIEVKGVISPPTPALAMTRSRVVIPLLLSEVMACKEGHRSAAKGQGLAAVIASKRAAAHRTNATSGSAVRLG
jgi:hypothetical protein